MFFVGDYCEDDGGLHCRVHGRVEAGVFGEFRADAVDFLVGVGVAEVDFCGGDAQDGAWLVLC